MPDSPAAGDEAAEKRRSTRWAYVILALLLAAVVVLRVMVLLYKVPSGSMIPTLVPGDQVLVARCSEVRRGEVIVFRFPPDLDQDRAKRVIGVPGDEVLFVDGRPVINGFRVPQCRVGRYDVDGQPYELFIEWLDERAYGILLDGPVDGGTCEKDNDCRGGQSCWGGLCGIVQGPWHVEPGHMFVVGDNRMNSHDSRTWDGENGWVLPTSLLTGRVKAVGIGGFSGRTFAPVDGPPILPEAAASLRPALEKCLKDKPAATTPP